MEIGFFGAILLALNIYAIWCVLQEPSAHSSGWRKIFWIIMIVIFPLLGTIIYFAFFRLKPLP